MMNLFNLFRTIPLTAANAEESLSSLIKIDFSRLPMTLKHMGIGMLSIFIVIGVIILIVFLLNKITASIANRKK